MSRYSAVAALSLIIFFRKWHNNITIVIRIIIANMIVIANMMSLMETLEWV